MKRIFALALGASFLSTAAMSASLYSSEADWTAAMSSVTDITLNKQSGPQTSVSQDGLTFSIASGGTNFFVGGPRNWSDLIDGFDIAISGPENLDIDISGGTTGFGFYLHEPTTANTPDNINECNATCVDSVFAFNVFDGATLVSSFQVNGTDDAISFVGFASPFAFDRVEIRDLTNTIDNEFFGEFRLGTLSAVPVPAGLPLLLAGLGSLAWVRRRKS